MLYFLLAAANNNFAQIKFFSHRSFLQLSFINWLHFLRPLVASAVLLVILPPSGIANVARADQFTSSSAASAKVSCTTTLPTSSGVGSPIEYPTQGVFFVPKQWSAQVCIYRVAGMELLAPKGWTGLGGIGADGGRSARLHPLNATLSAGQLITVRDDSACVGCGALDSARFFSAVRANWKDYGQPIPAPTAIPGLRAQVMSPSTMLYSLPNTASGLSVTGVAYAGILQGPKARETFMQMQVTLPSTDRELAQILLEFYRQHCI
jgi:Domain of unknown function (DUF4850)